MAPKNLLKQVFRNILHQKSIETMHQQGEARPPLPQPDIESDNRKQTESSGRTMSWIKEQTEWKSAEQACELNTLSTEGKEATKKTPTQRVPAKYAINFAHVLHLTETMTSSHIDTLEFTLSLLEVLENLSPHAESLRREMLEKKHMCQMQLEEIRKAKSASK